MSTRRRSGAGLPPPRPPAGRRRRPAGGARRAARRDRRRAAEGQPPAAFRPAAARAGLLRRGAAPGPRVDPPGPDLGRRPPGARGAPSTTTRWAGASRPTPSWPRRGAALAKAAELDKSRSGDRPGAGRAATPPAPPWPSWRQPRPELHPDDPQTPVKKLLLAHLGGDGEAALQLLHPRTRDAAGLDALDPLTRWIVPATGRRGRGSRSAGRLGHPPGAQGERRPAPRLPPRASARPARHALYLSRAGGGPRRSSAARSTPEPARLGSARPDRRRRPRRPLPLARLGPRRSARRPMRRGGRKHGSSCGRARSKKTKKRSSPAPKSPPPPSPRRSTKTAKPWPRSTPSNRQASPSSWPKPRPARPPAVTPSSKKRPPACSRAHPESKHAAAFHFAALRGLGDWDRVEKAALARLEQKPQRSGGAARAGRLVGPGRRPGAGARPAAPAQRSRRAARRRRRQPDFRGARHRRRRGGPRRSRQAHRQSAGDARSCWRRGRRWKPKRATSKKPAA